MGQFYSDPDNLELAYRKYQRLFRAKCRWEIAVLN
jgi:hypothetical protein